MHVLIVGGAGQLGQALVRHFASAVPLDSEPQRVRVLDMVPRPPCYDKRTVDYIQGSISDRDVVAQAVRDVDVVVLCVTPSLWSGNDVDFVCTNMQGILVVLNCLAATAGNRTVALVYISSIAVMNHLVSRSDIDETVPLPHVGEYKSIYDLTKRIGEQIVLEADCAGTAGAAGTEQGDDDESKGESLTALAALSALAALAVPVGPSIRTCSLRSGAIANTLEDIYFVSMRTNPIISLRTDAAIDMLYGADLAAAVDLAARHLLEHNPMVCGEVFYVTRGFSVTISEAAMAIGQRLGRRVWQIPPWMMKRIITVLQCVESRVRFTAVPLWQLAWMSNTKQTFNNAKFRAATGFEPQYSKQRTFDLICHHHRTEKKRRRSICHLVRDVLSQSGSAVWSQCSVWMRK